MPKCGGKLEFSRFQKTLPPAPLLAVGALWAVWALWGAGAAISSEFKPNFRSIFAGVQSPFNYQCGYRCTGIYMYHSRDSWGYRSTVAAAVSAAMFLSKCFVCCSLLLTTVAPPQLLARRYLYTGRGDCCFTSPVDTRTPESVLHLCQFWSTPSDLSQ